VASIHPSPLAGEGARRADEGLLCVILLAIQREPSATMTSQWFPLARKRRGIVGSIALLLREKETHSAG
jgi:hypothetical protein